MQQQNRTKVLILKSIAMYNKEEDNVGSVDTATKAMMRKNEFFADAVNLAVFGGKTGCTSRGFAQIGYCGNCNSSRNSQIQRQKGFSAKVSRCT